MSLIDILNHTLNFTTPALVMATLTALFARHLLFKHLKKPGLLPFLGISSALSILAAVAGLWLFGRDGKMATYAAMAVASATGAWMAARGWKA